MAPVGSVALADTAIDPAHARSTAELGSGDFMKLLITQLTNQDPLEPTKNEDLLKQIASIREIELNSTLTDSLRMLTGQQRFGAASSLMGQYVTSQTQTDGGQLRGLVVGIRFDAANQPILKLSDGSELPLEQVNSIEPPGRAADAMLGQAVLGVDRRTSAAPIVEGVVTGVRTQGQNEVVLELDDGGTIRLQDVVEVSSPVAA
jgi:flagellar basal-body rod modification protein FlgD